MKRIILLRHAKTESICYSDDDYSRNLTERGLGDSELVSDALIRTGIVPGLIISSPANRAKQTAELFASAFQIDKKAVEYQELLYGEFTIDSLKNLLAKCDESIQTLMIVGHNPDMETMAYKLSTDFDYYMPTCCAVTLESDQNLWKQTEARGFRTLSVEYPKKYKK